MSLRSKTENTQISQREIAELCLWLGGGEDGSFPKSIAHEQEWHVIFKEHRIIGRVLQRILIDVEVEDERLALDLTRQHRATLLSRKLKNAAADRFLSLLKDVEGLPVVVKGGSVAEIARDPFLIRDYGDTDIIVGNSSAVLPLLSRDDLSEYKVPVFHEEANILFEGESYDIHKHFPVWVVDGSAVDAKFLSNEPIVSHASSLTIYPINHDDLLRDASAANKYMPDRALVASPHWAAFVQIAHMYRDTIRLFLGWTYHRVRITAQEVLDIGVLCGTTGFDWGVFRDLVDRYRAHDQVAFCGSLVLAITKDDRLLKSSGQGPLFSDVEDKFGFRALVWYGFLLSFEIRPIDLLTKSIGIPDVFGDLGGPLLIKNNDVWRREVAIGGADRMHVSGDVAHGNVKLELDGNLLSLNIEISADQPSGFDLCCMVSAGLDVVNVNLDTDDNRLRISCTPEAEVIKCERSRDGDIDSAYLLIRVNRDSFIDYSYVVVGAGMLRSDGRLSAGLLCSFELDMSAEQGAKRH